MATTSTDNKYLSSSQRLVLNVLHTLLENPLREMSIEEIIHSLRVKDANLPINRNKTFRALMNLQYADFAERSVLGSWRLSPTVTLCVERMRRDMVGTLQRYLGDAPD